MELTENRACANRHRMTPNGWWACSTRWPRATWTTPREVLEQLARRLRKAARARNALIAGLHGVAQGGDGVASAAHGGGVSRGADDRRSDSRPRRPGRAATRTSIDRRCGRHAMPPAAPRRYLVMGAHPWAGTSTVALALADQASSRHEHGRHPSMPLHAKPPDFSPWPTGTPARDGWAVGVQGRCAGTTALPVRASDRQPAATGARNGRSSTPAVTTMARVDSATATRRRTGLPRHHPRPTLRRGGAAPAWRPWRRTRSCRAPPTPSRCRSLGGASGDRAPGDRTSRLLRPRPASRDRGPGRPAPAEAAPRVGQPAPGRPRGDAATAARDEEGR